MNIDVNNKLYVGKSTKKKKRKIIKNIKNSKLQLGVFVIVISDKEHEQLEIYPSYVLLQQYFKEKTMKVAGIAGSKEEAFEVVTDMVNDCQKANQDCNLKRYLIGLKRKKG